MYQALRENTGDDGFFQTIANAVTSSNFTGPRTGLWAVPQSANALEDVLGLTTALVLSRDWYSTTGVMSSFAVEVTRAGSGSLYGVVFMVPLLAAALVLVVLLLRTWEVDEVTLRTSSLKDLLGRNTGVLMDPVQSGRMEHGRQDIELVDAAKGGRAVDASLLGTPESGQILTYGGRIVE